jgi:cell wall-associated NlpC family hydrolase
MKFGITTLSIVPLRKQAAHASEQVSQLLFGETYNILNKQNNWLLVQCSYDGYEGWISLAQHCELSEKEFNGIEQSEIAVALDLLCSAASSHYAIPITAGSSLPYFDGMNFKILKEKFIYNGQALQNGAKNPAIFEKVAMRYLNAPYLWGGRSPVGIDCSGFTQIVYKFIGISLLRDAYQQAQQGNIVNFAQEAHPGDLAFFANDEGKIIHTGIVLKDNKIIHASGKVRIDKFDHIGIYHLGQERYTHKLKIIKRFF